MWLLAAVKTSNACENVKNYCMNLSDRNESNGQKCLKDGDKGWYWFDFDRYGNANKQFTTNGQIVLIRRHTILFLFLSVSLNHELVGHILQIP